MWFGFPYWVPEEESVVKSPIIKVNKKIRCDSCGKYMKSSTAYIIVEYYYLRCHMKEHCITRIYEKAKQKREEFELAALGAKQYGKA